MNTETELPEIDSIKQNGRIEGFFHRIWKYKLHYVLVIPAMLLNAFSDSLFYSFCCYGLFGYTALSQNNNPFFHIQKLVLVNVFFRRLITSEVLVSQIRRL
jgi:hypothetical protein